MTRQRQTNCEVGTQSHGPLWGSRAAECRRSLPDVIQGAHREPVPSSQGWNPGCEATLPIPFPLRASGLGAGRLSEAIRSSRANAMRMSTRMRESRDPASKRQPSIMCCASGDPSVRGVIGVRPYHLQGAAPRPGGIRHEEGDSSALLGAWGSVGTREGQGQWGILPCTVQGVLLRPGLRGPGQVAYVGGDARSVCRWGPAVSATFPPLFAASG
jgi:hypothetical protein